MMMKIWVAPFQSLWLRRLEIDIGMSVNKLSILNRNWARSRSPKLYQLRSCPVDSGVELFHNATSLLVILL